MLTSFCVAIGTRQSPWQTIYHYLVVLLLLLELLGRSVLVGVVLVVLTIVLVVHLLGVLTSLTLRTVAVDPVSTLGLAELVDLATDEAGEELLSKGVVDGLAC